MESDPSDAPPPDPALALLAGGLTRDLILSGVLPDLVRAADPNIRVLSDEERRLSLRAMLDQRPEHGQGVWVFGYGSLIWNPSFHHIAQRLAHAPDWHRSFCLSIRSGRGTPEVPGLMLGLRPGLGATGAVFRIAEEAVEQELDILWRREMVADGYIPRWVVVSDPEGEPFGHAIAFTINPDGPGFCELPQRDVIERLATARGGLGTAAEYLFRTRDGLQELGIHDPFVENLAQLVEARLKPVGA
jgi:cation transport protein ChaC